MALSTTVAIVGRPNVGKSTLFNRLAGRRLAVVHAKAGVTRDRLVTPVEKDGRRFYLVDTGGIGVGGDEIQAKTTASALAAVEEAGLLLFLIDVRTGITAEDQAVARILRRQAEKVWLLANKVEREEDRFALPELNRLGLGEPMPVSALHGEGIPALWDRLLERIPALPTPDERRRELRLAVVGRPNVGKSSIVNALLGQERMIVSEQPGTTRDAVDSRVKWHGHEIVLVDTAGLRRKSKVKERLEIFSNLRSLGAIDHGDIVLLVLDAAAPVAEQDQKIAAHAHDEGRGLILAVNKWDLVAKDDATMGEHVKRLRRSFRFLDYAPILFISAKTTQRIHTVLETAWRIYERRGEKLATPALNAAIQEFMKARPPHYHEGGAGKVFYAAQTASAPPTFSLFVNKPEWFPEHYRRYLSNRLRERYGFEGSPIRLRLEGRKRRER